MAVQNAVVNGVLPLTAVTTAELLVAQVQTVGNAQQTPNNLGAPVALSPVLIRGLVIMTTGAATTAVVVRIRNGSGLAGSIVASYTVLVTAASTVAIPLFFPFGPAPSGYGGGTIAGTAQVENGQSYSISVQQTGATGNGSVTYAAWETEG